jgi:hypothetical protein
MKLHKFDRDTWIYDAIKMAYEAGARCGLKNIEEECDKVYALTRYIHPPTKVLRNPPHSSLEERHITLMKWKIHVLPFVEENKDKMSSDEIIIALQRKYIISDKYKKLIENEYND